MTASPLPFKEAQPNGTMTPDLFVHGDAKFQYLTDSQGYVVMLDENCTFVFAQVDESLGHLAPSDMIVGDTNPVEMPELAPHMMPNLTMRETLCGRICEQDEFPREQFTGSMMLPHINMATPDESPRDPFTGSMMLTHINMTAMTRRSKVRKNLVILIRFADHAERTLPPPTDFDTLFNSQVPSPPIAPTGSVRTYFDINSYGTCTLESVIVGWVLMPKSEAYYADGRMGLSDVFPEALMDALDALDVNGFQWDGLDEDQDGTIDTVTLIHSGYGAEWGRTDEHGQTMHNRIWSHQWSLPSSQRWTSSTGIHVNRYITCPGLWDTRGSDIGHIGVIVHELGHYLGLPDLYGSGSATDTGIGVYGVMANAWGYDDTQHNPPHMCPWSKVRLGWSHPIMITQDGDVDVKASSIADEIYRINLGTSGSEYLLIENRQPHSFDNVLPGGGLAIWHIDESASHRVPGFPGQTDWPENGNHYKVALLQADGKYDLERGANFADDSDLFHASGNQSIGPSGDGKLPTTDTYQRGSVMSSDIHITGISESAIDMKFQVSFSPPESPSTLPTLSPSKASESPSLTPSMPPSALLLTKEIATPFQGGNGAEGCMFDVLTSRELTVTGFELHTYATSVIDVEIWSKIGSFQSYEELKADWTLVTSQSVVGQGFRQNTLLQLPPLEISADTVVAFYITVASGETMAYTNGGQIGMVISSNEDIKIFEGVGKSFPFGKTHLNRRWNGVLRYQVQGQSTFIAQSNSPTVVPSEMPSIHRSLSDRDLTTTFIGGTEQAGNMFDILTFKTLLITGFDLHISFLHEVVVEVYTKLESFRGEENSCAEWTLVTRTSVKGQGTGRATSLPADSIVPFFAERFQVRSFYITVASEVEGGMRYTKGTGSQDSIAQDDNLAIFEGVGKSYPCQKTFPNRIWNGVIRYALLEDAQDFETTFIGGRQAAGIMFDVDAINSLRLVGLDLHVASERPVALEIFIKDGTFEGHEDQPTSWRQVTNVILEGNGRGRATPVPASAFSPIILEANSKTGFYITFTENEMRYSDGRMFSEGFANNDMAVSMGVGKDYLFATSYSNRVWNGVFKYQLI